MSTFIASEVTDSMTVKHKAKDKEMKACRVKGCRFYGKKMVNWSAHAIEAHKLKMSVHEGLPVCTKKDMKAAYKDSKYRSPETCLYPGCSKKNSMYKRINRHLPKHGLSKRRYVLIKDMMKMQARFINKTDGKVESSFEQFCPAVQEAYPGCEVDAAPDDWFQNAGEDATMDKQVLQDEDVDSIIIGPPLETPEEQPSLSQRMTRSKARTPERKIYPNLFLFSETLLTDQVVISNKNKQVTLKPDDGEYQITFRFKKFLRSENHKRCFAWSLFWPSERLRMKLRREITSDSDKFFAFRNLIIALKPDTNHPVKLDYQCYLCHQFHPLHLYATPSVDNRPSHLDP